MTVSYKPSGVTGAQVQNGFSTVLSATANNGATVGTATFAALAPKITEFTHADRGQRADLHDPGQRRCDLVHGVHRRQNRADSDQCNERYADYRVCSFQRPFLSPFDLTSGPDGQMWFVEQNGNKIGHIPVTATSGSDISEIALPTGGSFRTGITAGSDSALYFTEQAWKSRWSHSNERDQHLGHYGDHAAGRGFTPSGMGTAADGTIWFTEAGSK